MHVFEGEGLFVARRLFAVAKKLPNGGMRKLRVVTFGFALFLILFAEMAAA